MSFEWFIARRYLTARRRQAFISLISGVSIVGVGVGVMAVIIALALMTGVQGELRDRIVGSEAHIYVYKIGQPFLDVDAELKRLMVPGVAGGAPAIRGIGLLTSSRSGAGTPVDLKGIDPVHESNVTDIGSAVVNGRLDGLVNSAGSSRDGIVLGKDLAENLGVTVGDSVNLMTPTAVIMPTYATPRIRIMRVVAIVKFGFYQVDQAAGFISLQAASSLLGKDGPDMMQLRLENLDDAAAISKTLSDRLGPGYQIQNWMELNRELYSALWLEKIGLSLTIGLIVVVAALNIVASLVLLVMEKSRDIAILRTMGAPAGAIRRIFVYQGLTIGLVGTLAGTVLGLATCIIADRYQLIRLPGEVYQITHLPFRVQPLDVAVVVIAAIGICLLATLYPSRQAGRLDPAEALRNQ
ncbi:MAG TPA: ABC transporter permease [Vicinamibacterales bacterium]|nr:ABC transporter permease [Vicinamibacterales bacterium]